MEKEATDRLQDANMTTASVNLNSSEISRAIGKISETNKLMVQQQRTQQRALQALLLHQEQSNETKRLHKEYKLKLQDL